MAIGEFKWEVIDIDEDIISKVSQRLEQGKEIIKSIESGMYSPLYFSWVLSFAPFIRAIDPLGEDYSDSLASDWNHAKYFGGNYPKDDYQYSTVCCQYLGVVYSILTGKAKVVKEKKNRVISRVTPGNLNCIFHKRDLPIQENFVFVIMPFSESWSDYIWRKEIRPIVQNIEGCQLICKRADDLFGTDVMQDIYESILTASIVIADITNHNPNVFYELGIAHALGKDFILLAQNADQIPIDLRRFRHCIYSNDGDGYEVLRQYIPNAIKEILSKKGKNDETDKA